VRQEKLTKAIYFNDIKNASIRIKVWRKLLPRAELFYAVKTNPDEEIVKACVDFGTGFDVASKNEMQIVLSKGVKPENCIFANPVKHVEEIQEAKRLGIKKMTFDSIEEMQKIKKHFPQAELVIRLATDAS